MVLVSPGLESVRTSQMSKWGKVKSFFNEFKVGDAIPRGFYFHYLNDPGFRYSLDCYRCYLARAGYLLQGDGKSIGIYVLAKRIPKDLTLSKVLFEAYGK